jgi:BNR repeat-like domain
MFCFLFSFLITTSLFGQWEPDVRLTVDDSSSNTSYTNCHSIATGPGGTIHVVWYDGRTGKRQIFYKRSTDHGNTWSEDIRLTNTNAQAYDPSIAVFDSTVHVVWQDSRSGTWDAVYYKRSTDAGLTWSDDVPLTNSAYNSRSPSVAADSMGVHVTWADERSGPEIYYRRSTDGGINWSDEQRLTFAFQESWYPAITLSGPYVHITWRDWRDHSFEVYYKRSTDYGVTWDSTDVRLSGDPNGSYNPCIAASGNFVHVIWWDTRFEPFEIYYKRSTDNGAKWSDDIRLTNDSSGSYNPSIVAAGANVHVFWEALADYYPEIDYIHSNDNGITWSADTELTARPNSYATFPSAAFLGNEIHLVWTDFRDNEYGEIYYKRNVTGNAGITQNQSFTQEFEPKELVAPNPFNNYARIYGKAGETFLIYDIQGRLMAKCRNNYFGKDLNQGVYFLKFENSNYKPIRVVKIK